MGVMERWRKGDVKAEPPLIMAPRGGPSKLAADARPGEASAAAGPVSAAEQGHGEAHSCENSRLENEAQPIGNADSVGACVDITSQFMTDDEDSSELKCQVPTTLTLSMDAPLVDGLRALLVHHLKRSIGTNTVTLSSSQAELLEHHLARLASYAQKIVHTLAFATRFLSKQQGEAESESMCRPQKPGTASSGAAYPSPMLPSSAPAGAPAADMRPSKKPLKLNDDELLSLYRSAQVEAAMEADWRGIQGPVLSRELNSSSDSSRRNVATPFSASASAPPADTSFLSSLDKDDPNREEYLRLMSRALQQSDRSPGGWTTEILDPSAKAACCGRQALPKVLHSSWPLGAHQTERS